MAEIAKRMGVELEWVDMPFDSLVAAVDSGKLDMSISCFNYDEERDKTVDFFCGLLHHRRCLCGQQRLHRHYYET
jgi:ABC-type amino acid transport substrate-binding protein